ncbi:ATP-grasp domain-containing protein [Streptomyces sp. NA02950]|uniref:ATP-grasp domain-containing protein n=1 Tax=Streptomyces sp. NA02950 TaxID=2742137 RepID=UPI001592710B|nr:ATP-grasp domain-containing protein [Streptomyces sp. NA02950]QKV91465.1 ATP-grasp domain-containing protein [Streptomyces sp. NA02950]
MATYTVVTLRWGSEAEQALRNERLGALGPVETVDRPDQVIDEVLRTVARGTPVDGVLALSEMVSYHASVAAAALGLPGNTPQTAIRLRRKDLQRLALSAAGVHCPAFAVVSDECELRRAAEELTFPLMLKPAVGMGSLCVTRAETPDALVAAYTDALERYATDRRVVGSRPIFVVEEVIAGQNWHDDERMGTRVSVESVVADGVIHHLAVTDKLPLAPPFREVGDVMPSGLPEGRVDRIGEATTDALRALGVTWGATHTELMLTPSGPVVIEVNGRIGGGVAELLRAAAGYDVLRQLGLAALGRQLEEFPEFTGHAFYYTPQAPEGEFEITDIGGEEELAALPGVLEVVRAKSPGDRMAADDGTIAHPFRVLATSRDFADFFAQLKAIEDAITLELAPVSPRRVQ